MKWKSDMERSAFEHFKTVLPVLKILGLNDSHQALSLLLRKRENKDRWDWDVLEAFMNTFEIEFCELDKSFDEGFRIVKEILTKTFAIKKRKGKPINLREIPWKKTDTEHLDRTLGVIGTCHKGVKDSRVSMFLMGFGFIIMYESKVDFARRRLASWAMPSITDKKHREQIIEDFLVLRGTGSDGKSDLLHIRNGFAHGHFEFIKEDRILLWDTSRNIETYRREFSWNDLKDFIIQTQKKLEFLEIYPRILIAVESLYRTYKAEWKRHR